MKKEPNTKNQEKEQFTKQLLSLINQINDISEIISKNSTKTENNPEEEWTKWQWIEFEITWKNKSFKGYYWQNSKNQDGIEWKEEKPNFGEDEEKIINLIKNKIRQELPTIEKKEIWQLLP